MKIIDDRVRRDCKNMAGMVVLQNGRMVYERYCNDFTAEQPVHVYSVTKSVVSALLGIAIGKGLIQSPDQTVISFFPGYTPPRGETTMQQITLRDLLTMTAPYKYRSPPYKKYFMSDDWVKTALDLLGGKGRVGTFRYTPLIGPDILSGILVRATGQSVLDFAREHLFDPLGIAVGGPVVFQDAAEQFAFIRAKTRTGWVADPQGVNTAGWGLCLTARDMAEIGQLYLDGGRREGRQVVPAAWVAESTTGHSRWGKLAYGYLWWVVDAAAGSYAALGDGGNVIYVNPRKKLVVAMASRLMMDAGSRAKLLLMALCGRRPKDRVALIQGHIEPLFEAAES